jgi:hypothetical protein
LKIFILNIKIGIQVAAALYGNKNALAHFICGPLDDCSLEVQEYQDYNTVELGYNELDGTGKM